MRPRTAQSSTKTKHKSRVFPLRPSFIHHEQSHLRTNTSKIIERTYPHTNCSTPWERNPKVILVYLLTAQRSIIRQHSFSSCTLTPRAHVLLVHTEHPTTTLSVDLYLHHGDRVYSCRLTSEDSEAIVWWRRHKFKKTHNMRKNNMQLGICSSFPLTYRQG